MKREILFRAKEVDQGFWVVGFYKQGSLIDPQTNKSKVRHIIETDVLFDIDVETLGQFTGLKDKYGRKIYEGDFVKWDKDNLSYIVTFRSGMFYASVEECNTDIYGGFPLWMLCIEEQHCEIVGNRYDTPVLLKKA